jgi:hypothetical protein
VAKAVGVLPMRPGSTAELFYLYFAGAATPPCAKMAETFGDIEYRGVVIFDRERGTLDFSGSVHRFPAFEMYATVNESAPVAVFRLSPPRGAGALDHGGDLRPVKASIVLE